ncbi:MAG: class I SAM-dependent methyltransferase, partial [Ilumatobacteraceae bacterium]
MGFGSGHNLPYYPPEVRCVLAVEPSSLAQRLAASRIDDATVDIEFVGLDGQHLPLADDCADAAVSTFTLCT